LTTTAFILLVSRIKLNIPLHSRYVAPIIRSTWATVTSSAYIHVHVYYIHSVKSIQFVNAELRESMSYVLSWFSSMLRMHHNLSHKSKRLLNEKHKEPSNPPPRYDVGKTQSERERVSSRAAASSTRTWKKLYSNVNVYSLEKSINVVFLQQYMLPTTTNPVLSLWFRTLVWYSLWNGLISQKSDLWRM